MKLPAYKKASKEGKGNEKVLFQPDYVQYIIIPFLFFVNLFTSMGEYWFWYPALAWGMVLAFRAFKIFGSGNHGRKRDKGNYENQQKTETMEKSIEDDIQYQQAKKQVEQLTGFLWTIYSFMWQ